MSVNMVSNEFQRLSPNGAVLWTLDRPQHDPEEFCQLSGVVLDFQGRPFLFDSNKRRVQRFLVA